MKKLQHKGISIKHFISKITGEQETDILIRVNGYVEEKYLQIEVNELDIPQTPKENIEEEIARLETIRSLTENESYSLSCYNKIKGLQKALSYLN